MKQVRFGLLAVALVVLLIDRASAALLLYEPFDYTAGQNLGGTDPDGAGATAGTPVGQSGTYDPGVGGGVYTWYARGTSSNYQAPNDTVITSGNLSYSGLAASQGNSVSYGSAAGSGALFADSIALPSSITSGSLYASFIIKVKSNASTLRHSPASFVIETSTAADAGLSMATSQSGSAGTMPGGFWMRRDPTNGTTVTNFSPSKSNSDGIGPGATGPSAGWQHSVTSGNIESNQFGAVNGQAPVNPSDSSTYQTYFVVVKYAFDQMATTNGQNDAVSLWMNPGSGTLGTATGEADASQAASGNLGSYYAALNAFGTGALDVTSINSFALFGHRQNTTESIAVDFDELRIGTTWADVTPAAVPEPNALLLAIIAALALGSRRAPTKRVCSCRS